MSTKRYIIKSIFPKGSPKHYKYPSGRKFGYDPKLGLSYEQAFKIVTRYLIEEYKYTSHTKTTIKNDNGCSTFYPEFAEEEEEMGKGQFYEDDFSHDCYLPRSKPFLAEIITIAEYNPLHYIWKLSIEDLPILQELAVHTEETINLQDEYFKNYNNELMQHLLHENIYEVKRKIESILTILRIKSE